MATKKKAKKRVAAPSKAAKKPNKVSKKKANPRISPFDKRSKAAKKGWATRRKNAVKKRASNNQRKLKNAQLALPKKKRKAPAKARVAGKTKKELLAIVREQEKQIARLELTKDWVDAMPPEYLSRDGHITVQPSLARHDRDYDVMRERLEQAYDANDGSFDSEVYEMAAEYDYEVREIYTMFWSP